MPKYSVYNDVEKALERLKPKNYSSMFLNID